MIGHVKAPAGAPRLVACRRWPADRRGWWEPWTWFVMDAEGGRWWIAYYGRDDDPRPWPGVERTLLTWPEGYRLDRSRPRVHRVGRAVLYRVPEQCEEYAWPLVRLAPSVEDAAPADVAGGGRGRA